MTESPGHGELPAPGSVKHRVPSRVGGGYLPSLPDMMKAYVWRMGGDCLPDVGVEGDGLPEVRELFATMLFPPPYRCETFYEARCLVAKCVVADGLWSEFTPGKPFTEYLRPDGTRVYDDEHAQGMGWLVEDAVEFLGPTALFDVTLQLMQSLVMPG